MLRSIFYYFFKPLGTTLKKIGDALLYILRKIKANIILFGVIVLLITLAGYSLRYMINPSYQTDGIFVPVFYQVNIVRSY